MAETATETAGAAAGGGGIGRIFGALKGPDVALATGILTIIMMLVMPVPPFLLDIMLALSITFSVLILMTSLFIEKPLELSAFPTILLFATLLRLGLNLASTRLVLAHGHENSAAAGHVIEFFGNFLIAGQVVIGFIVFIILIIVNFVVITKGSGRIAEVAARFSLDAMPGKQMAIDADMSAGLIDETQARARRTALEDEMTFYGSMDGAAKFVRGDAIAGLLITAVNMIGGIIIGVAMNGMPFQEALQRYTLLSVGDGLVSQIPALIVSTAAGLLVTKAGASGGTDKAMFGQLSNYPKAVAMTAGLMLLIGLIPGVPMFPFLLMAGSLGYLAWKLFEKEDLRAAEVAAKAEADALPPPPTEEPITSALTIDAIRLELGYGLLPLIHDESGYRLTEQIKALRRQLATEMGFVMPSVRILDNMQLPSTNYVIRLKETEAGRGDIRPNMILAMDPRGEPVQLAGEETREPAFGLPATWIDAGLKEEAAFRGYTVVDAATVVTTHLTELIKDNMADLLSYAETQKLMNDLPVEQQKLVADLVPSTVTVTLLQRVLQALLTERVSIRDLPTILEGTGEAAGFTHNVSMIAEHVRSRLARQLCAANADAEGVIPLVTLSPLWEQNFAEAIIGQGDDRQLAMAPSQLQEFMTEVRITFERMAMQGEIPILLTSPGIRPFVRSIIERFRPATIVMSQAEIHPKARIRTLGQI